MRTPGIYFAIYFYDPFGIFLPHFRYSSPIHMSSWWPSITYLGTVQKPAHTILRWGPRGPQAHQCWNTMQAWVWLFTHWRFLLGNGSPVWLVHYLCLHCHYNAIFFDFSVFEKYNIIEIWHNIKEGIKQLELCKWFLRATVNYRKITYLTLTITILPVVMLILK